VGLAKILENTRRETQVPAIAGIVVDHQEVVDQAVVGVRRLGHHAPATIDDRFHTGSNAKAMTATLCASLIDQGVLRWDMRPLDAFSDLSGRVRPEYEAITLEMLLRHTAGIPPYTDDETPDFVVPELDGIPDERQTLQFSRWLLQTQGPVHEPGKQFSYSNAGYSIAAAMAEAATEQPWADLLHTHVFQPLGIEAVTGSGWPARHDPDQPWGHLVRDGESVPHSPHDEYQLEPFLAPAGDVSMSLPAYGRFLQMNLRALQGRDTPIPGDLLRRLHNDGQPGYGMGWGVKTLMSLEDLGLFSTHGGSAGTFILVAGISHVQDCAVALATNSGLADVIEVGFKTMLRHFVPQART
jgi:D-alanyl-D-alanine carboxypeptidase